MLSAGSSFRIVQEKTVAADVSDVAFLLNRLKNMKKTRENYSIRSNSKS